MITREVNNHLYYQQRLKALGFPAPAVTSLDKDALNSLIREQKPSILIMGARFYEGCTPFLMRELKKEFPKVKMVAVCIGHYPPDLAMEFILYGVNSYLTSFDGVDQWNKGIIEISKGRDFVSPSVNERILMRKDYPKTLGNITERHLEVLRLICCGFKDLEIADLLHISRSTVDKHKTYIFTVLNVRNPCELMRAALYLHILTLEDTFFYPQEYDLNPLPDYTSKKRKTA